MQHWQKTVTEIKAFLGLCNFFRTHIRNFASPFYVLTRKDKNFKSIYTDKEKAAFKNLKSYLCSEQVMSYPIGSRQNFCITRWCRLCYKQKTRGYWGNSYPNWWIRQFSNASRQLVTHEKNYSSFLLKMQDAWGMGNGILSITLERKKIYLIYWPQTFGSTQSYSHKNTLQTSTYNAWFRFSKFNTRKELKCQLTTSQGHLSKHFQQWRFQSFNEDLPSMQRNCKQTNDNIINPNTNPLARTLHQAESCFIDQGILWKKLQPTSS